MLQNQIKFWEIHLINNLNGSDEGYFLSLKLFHNILNLVCVDNVNTYVHNTVMENKNADINIHLRAKTHDRELIDQAANLIGANRSQFMMASALKEAKNVLLDQTTIYADNQTFQKVLDWMDTKPTKSEQEGMKNLMQTKPPWQHD